MTDSSRPTPDDASQGSPAGRSRPAAFEPTTTRTSISSLPWRPSDTGLGEGGRGNDSTASLDPLSEEGLERLAERLASGHPDDGVFVTRCSWCHRFDVDGWCDVSTAARRLRDRDPGSIPTITHGICETCVVGFEDSL